MKNLKTLGRRAAAVTCAALLATSLMAPAAFADPAASESSGLAAAYKGTTYRVTVYSGNQGTFADGETQAMELVDEAMKRTRKSHKDRTA